jgi:PilZ domain
MTRATPLPHPPALEPPRGASRAAISLLCEVRQGARPWQRVVLEDLSASGFRITGLNQPSKIAPLSIRIPGMQLLSARIRWVEGAVIGCEFAAPLHVAVYDHLVREARAATR